MPARSIQPAPSSRPRSVVLVLRLAYASHRDILHGISRSVRPHGLWRFRVIDYSTDENGAQLAAALASGDVDGVIATSIGHPAIAAGLRGWNGPLVVIGSPGRPLAPPGRTAPLDIVGNDDAAIGRCGADYLESLGRFRAFGFVMHPNTPHGGRCEGFLSRLRGRTAAGIRLFRDEDRTGGNLGRWLRGLPKPAAVMAFQDQMAFDVLAAATAAGISVPGELAVLGVDNDEFLCETASPSLTSIAPDHVRLGELAAQTLKKRFAKPRSAPVRAFIAQASVVERRSTKAVPPAVALAARAMEFIRRNATRGIGVADVVAHLGVSRTLAALRFRQVYGESLLGAVLRTRLEEVRRRLAETDLPVGKIAAECGFRSPKHAMRLFRARFGCPMGEWRKRAAKRHS